MLQYIRVVVALLLVIVPLSVRAGPIDLLAESDTDTVGGSELFLRAFNSLDDFYNDVKGPGDWSALDVGAGFSVAGMTWIDSVLYLLAESDTDTVGGSELFLRAFNSLDDFYNDVKGPGDWSALDVGAGFSVAGMTWIDSVLYLLAESDTDTVGGSELFLRAFNSLDDFYNDVKGPGDWSALDVGAGFSVAGMTWDGSDLYLLAESDTDTVGGSELFLRAFDSIDDFYNDVKGPGDWSALDVGAGFSVAGLASRSVAVPEPGTLALFGIGLAGMGLARRRKTI